MRWELEEIKSSKYLLFLGPPRPRSCYIGSYWQLKEGGHFLLCYSHWQVCRASVNSTSPTAKLNGSPKQNTKVEAEP